MIVEHKQSSRSCSSGENRPEHIQAKARQPKLRNELTISLTCRDQYTANLALKINVKLDGVNCVVEPRLKLQWQKEPYMVVGTSPLSPFFNSEGALPKPSS